MRAAVVSSSSIFGHRWRYLNAGPYLGEIERCEVELKLARQHLKNAQARFNRAESRLKFEKAKSRRLEREGKIVPLRQGE